MVRFRRNLLQISIWPQRDGRWPNRGFLGQNKALNSQKRVWEGPKMGFCPCEPRPFWDMKSGPELQKWFPSSPPTYNMPSWALLPLTLTIWGLSRRVDAMLENIGLGLILASLGGWGSVQKRDSYLKWVRGWKWLWMTVGQLPMIFSEFFLRKLFDQNHLVTLQRRRCNVENSLFSLINIQDSISYPSSQGPQRDLIWVLIPMVGSEKNLNGCGCPQWHYVWPVGDWVS